MTQKGGARLKFPNVSDDTEHMNRPRTPQFRYEILERTNHYRILAGRTYRDCVARRLEDGALRMIGIPA
jgi:hypothetical protein